jgi:hypothetical protein
MVTIVITMVTIVITMVTIVITMVTIIINMKKKSYETLDMGIWQE